MADVKDIVKLAIDTRKNRVSGNFSTETSMDVLRESLIEANGGSTKLEYKKMRNGASNGLFEIIEEIIQKVVIEGLQEDNFFQQFVDYRNLKLGDENTFYSEDPSLFVIADTAEGTQSIRRQRLNVGSSTTLSTSLKTVKVYEELNRLLSGRIDFNMFIDRIAESFNRKQAIDIYNAFIGAFTALPATFAVSGAYSETGLIAMIDHVESATGKKAMILGTRTALRKVTQANVSESAKEAMNNMGYYGVFNGTPMMRIQQVHTPNTYNFAITDNDLYIVPVSGVKPIKYVTEGDAILIAGNPLDNQDLTQEYLVGDRSGIAVQIAELFGIYRIS